MTIAFDQLVRVHFHERAVFAGARLGFVRVADNVLCFRRILGTKDHFMPVGKPAPPRPRRLDFFTSSMMDSGVICCRAFSSAFVAAVFQINVNLAGILDAPTSADERGFKRIAVVKSATDDRFGSRFAALVEFFEMRSNFRMVRFS